MSQTNAIEIQYDQDQKTKQFESPQELVAWLKGLVAGVRWLTRESSQVGENAYSRIESESRQIINSIVNVQDDPEKFRREFNRLLKEKITQFIEKYVIFPSTPYGEFIQKVKEEHGLISAASAYGFFITDPTEPLRNTQKRDEWIGYMRASDFLLNRDDKSVEAINASLTSLKNDFSTTYSDQKRKIDDSLNNLEKMHDKLERRYKATRKIGERAYREFNNKQNALIQEGLDSLEATKRAYSEHMELRASVEYWTTKEVAHIDKASELRVFLVVFFIASIAIILWFSKDVYALLGETIEDFSPQTIFIGSISLLCVSITLWAGRVMVRMYLSEQHLAIDAKQRATMVRTYLALINESAADKAERNIILKALFRPTTDGIVKDDSAPVISFEGLLNGSRHS
ncbi:DUF6161 domain-containing protein [Hyphococcus formosus]|uniref:DUF6161 domain-containing protein n=1 Tax=Hyphococcus formosus TaxID=3143534 RepID=UPI00398AA17B